jgi:hypothetical protein
MLAEDQIDYEDPSIIDYYYKNTKLFKNINKKI